MSERMSKQAATLQQQKISAALLKSASGMGLSARTKQAFESLGKKEKPSSFTAWKRRQGVRHISVYLNPDAHARLKEIAKAEHRSLTCHARHIVEKSIEGANAQ